MSDIPDYCGAVSTSTEGLVNSIAVDVRTYADTFFGEELITESTYSTVTDTRIKQDDAGRARDIVKDVGLKVKANPEESFCKLLKVLKDLPLNDLAESIERKLGELMLNCWQRSFYHLLLHSILQTPPQSKFDS